MERIVIVGGGAAAVSAAETLRVEGFSGSVTIIAEESGLPYDRPPLSKQVLTREWEVDRVLLRTREELDNLGVELLSGRRASDLDLASRTVGVDGGSRIPYDGLVLATGVTARPVPADWDYAGVHVLRSKQDALALQAAFDAGPRVVVVGAGLIGTEAAASARKLGLEVTLVDQAPIPLLRQLGPRLGSLVADLHRSRGVRLAMGTGVRQITASGGHVTSVELEGGSTVAADCVLVAVGSVPATDWLRGSGLRLGDGIECDQFCMASPRVAAAGDVASWHHPGYGRRIRIEHRTNATEHGAAAARNLLGAAEPYTPIPYFWTDQYDTKIQVHGLSPTDGQLEIAEGSIDDGRFVALHRDGERVASVTGWNSARQLRHYRPLLAHHRADAPVTPSHDTRRQS